MFLSQKKEKQRRKKREKHVRQKSKPDLFQLKKQAKQVLRENSERALELICQAEKLDSHSIPIKDMKVECLLRLQMLNQDLRLAESLLKISGRSFDFFRLAKVHFMAKNLTSLKTQSNNV